MPSGRLMKHLFLPLLGFGVIAAATAASAQTAPPDFVSAIGDNTNVVFVENHIVIDRPANEIFDFVSRRVISSSALMEVRIGTRKGDTQKPLGWGRKPRPCARCRSRRLLPTGPR